MSDGLWMRTPEELDIIRKYSWLHTELVPYMYHYVVTAHEGGRRLQTPIDGKYHYMFGEYLLVAPVYKDDLNTEIQLPEGRWRYWFDDTKIIEGPVKFVQEFPLDEYPVFVKEGAIIPMDIKRHYTGFGDAADEGYLTFLIYPDLIENSFEVFRESGESTSLKYLKTDAGLSIEISGRTCPHHLKIALDKKPSSVYLDDRELLDGMDFNYNSELKKLSIKTERYDNGRYTINF
ncbi:MAG: glycoside hydrolase family 31 protein [Cyclobacteriaceae bacterium]|nr:glycoside hydrolase family 31 protein [Cyclobacteriaceae bacterium]